VTARRRPTSPIRSGHRLAGAAAASALLAGCTFGPPPPNQSGAPPNLPTPSPSASLGTDDGGASTVDVVASHLDTPWGLAFLPDGSALVTERTRGKILRVGQPATPSGLTVTTVGTVVSAAWTGDDGVLGIAVSPHYATDSAIYVYYSTRIDNRIGRLTLPLVSQNASPSGPASPNPSTTSGPGTRLVPTPILTGIPHGTTDDGGALAFGPDDNLYASTGDAGHPALSRDPKSLAGKILRMTPAGKPVTAKGSLVYASGFHNIEGMAFDDGGRLYAADAGRSVDSLLRITADADGGWAASPKAPNPAALQTWPLDKSTCAGVAVIENALATACLAGQQIWVVQLTSHGTPFGAPAALLPGQFGRLRAAAAAPDGALWFGTSNTDGHGKPDPADDRLIRIVLADAGAGKT
jgi:glucose/arabinose dehydrogenase